MWRAKFKSMRVHFDADLPQMLTNSRIFSAMNFSRHFQAQNFADLSSYYCLYPYIDFFSSIKRVQYSYPDSSGRIYVQITARIVEFCPKYSSFYFSLLVKLLSATVQCTVPSNTCRTEGITCRDTPHRRGGRQNAG